MISFCFNKVFISLKFSPLGVWVTQLVRYMTLDFGSGHGFMVCEFKPHVGLCTDSMEPAWDSLSPSHSAPPPLMRAFVVSQNK